MAYFALSYLANPLEFRLRNKARSKALLLKNKLLGSISTQVKLIAFEYRTVPNSMYYMLQHVLHATVSFDTSLHGMKPQTTQGWDPRTPVKR